MIKDDKGGLEAWLNIGNFHDSHMHWVSCGKITQGWNTANIAIADIDGDGMYLKLTNKNIKLMFCCSLYRSRRLFNMGQKWRAEWLPQHSR